MKRITLFLLLALLLTTGNLFAQSKAVITGKVTNPLSNYITVVTHPSPLVPNEVENEVELDGNHFRLEIPVGKATVAELVHGNEVVSVYLEPGYELNLTFNGNNFLKTFRFEGRGANENNYLAQYAYRFEDQEEYQVLPVNIKLYEKEFIKFLDNRKKDQLKFLERYTSTNPVSANFEDFAQAEIEFSYADDRITYFSLREQVVKSSNSLAPSPAYFQYLEALDMQRSANLLSPAFTNFLRNYAAHYATEAGYPKSSKEFYITSYKLVKKKLTAEVQAFALAQILKQSLQKGHLGYSEEMFRDFKTISKKPEVNAYLEQLYNQHKGFAIGTPAPDFKLKNTDGEAVSLSDFKGKVVYLSFWRTNCGLCLMDVPHLQELNNKLDGKNIVFLSVGIDEDEEAWRKIVEKKQLQGVQLHMKGMNAELVKQYDLKDVPAYFLIDEEGNLITAKPRRPNDREIEKDLLKLVNRLHALAK